jgi:membrane-bound ClpP family serine protease
MTPAVWIFLLVAVGLGMILLEVFVPSGGVLGLLAVAALGAGVITAFVEEGALAGVAVLGGVVMAVPFVLVAAFRWFPLTPLGRRVLPPPPAADEVIPDGAERARLRRLVGRSGTVTSELVPWGVIEIDGREVDAFSEGGPIASGTMVEAVGVQGRALVVRPSPTPPAGQRHESGVGPREPAAVQGQAGPRLSTVLEEFDFDEIHGKEDSPPSLDSPPSANQA